MKCCLSKEQEQRALVSKNDSVSIMDATLIQQYIAILIDKFPIEEDIMTEDTITKIDTKTTVRFSNNKKWTNVYAYIYNDKTGESNSTWPGEKLTIS